MPILSGRASYADRPIIGLLARPTGARIDRIVEQGQTPKMKVVRALIDTGANDTCIERSLAIELDLDPIGEVDVHGVTSGSSAEKGIVYRVQFLNVGVPAVELVSSTRVIAVNDLGRFDARILLGRDLLARGALIYNGPLEHFTFAF